MSGHFGAQWLTRGDSNKAGWLHGRVWAALTQSVPKGYVANSEVRLSTPGGPGTSFKPDLLVCDGADSPILAVEFESTNSSDRRVLTRDIARLPFLATVETGERPAGVLIITTLPSQPVVGLPMYAGLSPGTPAGRALRRMNPYAFHKASFLQGLKRASHGSALSIAWANLDVDAIRLEFWDGAYKKRPTWPLSLVPTTP